MRSAERTVASRWAITRVVRPCMSRSRVSWTARSPSASRAEVADDRVVPLRKGEDEILGGGQTGGSADLLRARLGPAVTDVVEDARREHRRLLRHEGHAGAKRHGIGHRDGNVIDEDAPRLR